jgi:hypothetical protein
MQSIERSKSVRTVGSKKSSLPAALAAGAHLRGPEFDTPY